MLTHATLLDIIRGTMLVFSVVQTYGAIFQLLFRISAGLALIDATPARSVLPVAHPDIAFA